MIMVMMEALAVKIMIIMTVFIATRWKLVLEHGEVDGASISVVRPPRIVHMLQKLTFSSISLKTIPRPKLFMFKKKVFKKNETEKFLPDRGTPRE